MARTVRKRIYLMRAAFIANAPAGTTLQTYLQSAIDALPKIDAKPQLDHTSKESATHGRIRINEQRKNDQTLEVKIVSHAPGELASTVPITLAGLVDVEGSAVAPANSAFKNGDCFVLVDGNNVLCIHDHLRIEPVGTYLRALFQQYLANDPIAVAFDLRRVARKNKMDQIDKEGIAQVDMNSTLYAATVDMKGEKSGAGEAIFSALREVKRSLDALIQEDEQPEFNEHLGELQVTLSISASGKTRADPIAQKAIEAVGRNLLAGDAFIDDEHLHPVIVTKKGNRIGTTDSTVSEEVSIHRREGGSSLSDVEAWSHLRAYHAKLTQSGVMAE